MTSCSELADYDWLTGSEAGRLLDDLSELNEPLHTAAERLRRDLSAERVHLLFDQVDLRRRAAFKFARPDVMFFTRLGLEQATDSRIAAHKALRFAEHRPVADLCCGIGGDLLALGEVSGVTGVDCDPVATHLAAANAHALGVAATVETCEVADVDARDFASWHIDPDRRPAGKRTSSPEWSSPHVDDIERLLEVTPNAAVKLAPAAEVPDAWIDKCELEWISRDRECRQLVAWHGEFAGCVGQRRASLIAKDGSCERTVVGEPDVVTAYVSQLGRFLFEPDPAVLAAHLTGTLAAEHGLAAFSAGIAYLTGSVAIEDPALACFEIDDILPLKPRIISKSLQERHIGRLEIKKRGVAHEPEVLRKQLKLSGDGAAVLVLTQLNGKHVAILTRRAQRNLLSPSLLPAS